jgi:hypothetical protein
MRTINATLTCLYQSVQSVSLFLIPLVSRIAGVLFIAWRSTIETSSNTRESHLFIWRKWGKFPDSHIFIWRNWGSSRTATYSSGANGGSSRTATYSSGAIGEVPGQPHIHLAQLGKFADSHIFIWRNWGSSRTATYSSGAIGDSSR